MSAALARPVCALYSALCARARARFRAFVLMRPPGVLACIADRAVPQCLATKLPGSDAGRVLGRGCVRDDGSPQPLIGVSS